MPKDTLKLRLLESVYGYARVSGPGGLARPVGSPATGHLNETAPPRQTGLTSWGGGALVRGRQLVGRPARFSPSTRARHGSWRLTVLTRSTERSNVRITSTPVLSACATK